MGYEFLEHTADFKFHAWAPSLEEAFEESVKAVSEFLSKGHQIQNKETKKISVSGIDLKQLFYNFLDEIIYLLDAEDFVVSSASVNIEGLHLTAELFGDYIGNYPILEHIKSATYAEMEIKRKNNLWHVQAVLDI